MLDERRSYQSSRSRASVMTTSSPSFNRPTVTELMHLREQELLRRKQASRAKRTREDEDKMNGTTSSEHQQEEAHDKEEPWCPPPSSPYFDGPNP
ncbi:unnamed protein product, partial [Amoebophrya sp. A120]|eukprot:GSA120T00020979001.1